MRPIGDPRVTIASGESQFHGAAGDARCTAIIHFRIDRWSLSPDCVWAGNAFRFVDVHERGWP